jgi:hypothetical protein
MFKFTAVLVLLVACVLPTYAQQSVDIPITTKGRYHDLVRGGVWGNTGIGGLLNTYMYTPQNLDQAACFFIAGAVHGMFYAKKARISTTTAGTVPINSNTSGAGHSGGTSTNKTDTNPFRLCGSVSELQADSDLNRKQINPFHDRLMQLRQRWDNKLVFPLSELGKRYLRQDFGIVLDCVLSRHKFFHRESFSLAILLNGENRLPACASGELHIGTSGNDRKFPVLIESVHVMDDADRVIFRIAPSFVWLQIEDQGKHDGIHNPLYFSVVSVKFFFRKWLFLKDGELDGVFVIPSVCTAGEMPDYMVETRPQVVDDFASQDTKPLRDGERPMVINSILPILRVWGGHDWILTSFKESDDFTVKISDVLIGPL